MEKFPLKIDDTLLFAKDEVTKRLGRKLKGEFVGSLSLNEEEKKELKDFLKERQTEALVLPERIELVHRLGKLLEKLPKNSTLKNILIGLLEHEREHLYILKEMPHHKVLSLAIDGLLLSYLEGFEAKKVGKYIEICLEASNIHSRWLHEGYAINSEINKLCNFRNSPKIKERIEELRSLKDKVSLINKHELRDKSHEIGSKLTFEASKNLEIEIPKVVSLVHSFYAEFKIKGENKKIIHTYIPDYLLLELANLNGDLNENNLPQIIEEISPRFVGPMRHKIERISPLKYAPIPEIKRKLEAEHPILKVLPEEFQPLCEPICKNPLREALTRRYVVWDLDNGKRFLYTDKKAFRAVKRKECISTLLLKLQELKAEIIPVFIKNMDLDWPVDKVLSFEEFMKRRKCPKVYFESEPVEWMEDEQSELQQKYDCIIRNIKSLSKEIKI